MNYTIINKLGSIDDLIKRYPLSEIAQQRLESDRQEVKNILTGEDPRLLIIVGPCSAWPKEAVLNYAHKLAAINEKVKHSLKLVMRVYIQKPRTTKGWLGPVNQPDPFSKPNIALGIEYIRDMMVKVLEMGLPISDEALFTHNAKGFLELLSWVAIGARSSEDQEHRIFASAIDCAVGLKNPTQGSLPIAVNSIIAAQHPHTAVFDGNEVQTHGNPYAHLVLRGSQTEPNYSIKHLEEVYQLMQAQQIKNPSIIIDTSHDNCLVQGKKNHALQPSIVFEVLESLKQHSHLKSLVKGFMLESFLQAGNQKVDESKPYEINLNGLSITDPCIGWDETESFLLKLAEDYAIKN